MMSVNNQHVRHGYLSKCPQKVLNPFKSKWQSRWFILFGNSEQGRVRLEYYDNEKGWQQEKGKRVIPLSNCVSIKPVWNKEYQNVIEIVIQDKTIHLAASSKEEEKAWFKDLCKAVFGNANRNSIVQVIEKPSSELDFGYHSLDRTSVDGNTDSPRPLHTVEESLQESQDNTHDETQSADRISAVLNESASVNGSHSSSEHLVKNQNSASVASELSSLVSFESGFDDGSSVASTVTEASSFPVTVRATIASQKANMSGTYLLQINPLNIVLIDVLSQKHICEWPIQYLRRYGRGRTKFSFEASEKCKYGKGVYTFNTLEGDHIFHLVDMHARGISMRNQLLRKRTSMPDGFKPLGNASKRLHHSEGKLIDKFSSDMNPQEIRLTDSVNDMNDLLLIGPGDSVSQIGTLRSDTSSTGKRLADDEEERYGARGASIGSGISLEIAQNISHSGDELKPVEEPSNLNCDRYEQYEENPRSMHNKPISPIQEETLTQTLEYEPVVNRSVKTVTDKSNRNDNAPNRTSTPNTGDDTTTNPTKKIKISIRRSSSLKLPSALKRSNSSGKDNSVKKSSSVKRSSSFRNRFFKSKNSEDEKKSEKNEKKEKFTSKSAQDLTSEPTSVISLPLTTIEKLDKQIAQEKKAKDILAKAIEDDMNRNSENELIEGTGKRSKKTRRFPVRHKSNEMLGNGTPDKAKINRLSSSFAGYDYKGHAVLSKTNSLEDENEEDELRRLQRRTQSVMKKVELYESLKRQAEDNRNNTSYTLWRKQKSMSSPRSKDAEK